MSSDPQEIPTPKPLLFGQPREGECSPGRVTARKIFHAAGIVVDRGSTPNHIYVADTGNNRILGFRSYDHKEPERIFGQADAFSGAPNRDCRTGRFGPARRDSLCLLDVPGNPNLEEQWMRVSMDVDASGNLYVPDFHNNRVLIFNAPFSDGRDNLPNFVIGQDDFTQNSPNRNRKVRDEYGLHLSIGGVDHVSSRGVSVDRDFNVWVADTFNYRVLRFPRGSRAADLVLGAPRFDDPYEPWGQAPPSGQPPDRLVTPTLARVDPDTGELYVVDEYPDGFKARIVVFTPPFHNGMQATRVLVPRQRLQGDYAAGYTFSHATGLVFNPFKTDDVIPRTKRTYREGILWVHDATRAMLLDRDGEILQAIAAPNVITFGGKDDVYANAGMSPETPFNLVSPGGNIGFDSANDIYLCDERWHRISRFALPYRVQWRDDGVPVLPSSNGGFFPGTFANDVGPASFSGRRIGALTFGNQLIVRDYRRYLVWNDYLTKQVDGPPADIVVGQADGYTVSADNAIYGGSLHAIDDQNRLWAASVHGRLLNYQLPMAAGAEPLGAVLPLYWADDLQEVPYQCYGAVAYERATGRLWIFDNAFHRLLRVRLPGASKRLLVDAVIGQTNKTDGLINRGMSLPDASSLGDVNAIRFDREGNFFVVDNTYEQHLNARVIAFLAADMAGINQMFPPIAAQRVFVAERFNQPINEIVARADAPHSPVAVAFNSRNEMVLGNDGYGVNPRTRMKSQLFLYRTPMTKQTPDAVIEFPMGTPGELSFDDQDNLVLQDHTWSKLWILKPAAVWSYLRQI